MPLLSGAFLSLIRVIVIRVGVDLLRAVALYAVLLLFLFLILVGRERLG